MGGDGGGFGARKSRKERKARKGDFLTPGHSLDVLGESVVKSQEEEEADTQADCSLIEIKPNQAKRTSV